MFFSKLISVTYEERAEEGNDWGDKENGQTSNSLDLKESWVLFMFYETPIPRGSDFCLDTLGRLPYSQAWQHFPLVTAVPLLIAMQPEDSLQKEVATLKLGSKENMLGAGKGWKENKGNASFSIAFRIHNGTL